MNIRGVHAVVNIISWHVIYEWKNIKFNKDFEHGVGRSQISCTDPYGPSRDGHCQYRTGEDLAQVYGF